MKKISLFIIVLLASCTFITQQPTFAQRLNYGLSAGMNFSSIYSSSPEAVKGFYSDDIRSLYVGAHIAFPLNHYLFIQPMVSLKGRGGKGDALDENGSLMIMEARHWTVTVPINLVVKPPAGPMRNLYLGLGPYAAYGFGGNFLLTINGKSLGKEPTKFGDGPNDEYKRMEYGLNFIGGYQLDNGVNMGVTYARSWTNIFHSSQQNWLNNVISFFVGYSFWINKKL